MDDGVGRRKVPLAQTVVVGRVCVTRMRGRKDARQAPPEPG